MGQKCWCSEVGWGCGWRGQVRDPGWNWRSAPEMQKKEKNKGGGGQRGMPYEWDHASGRQDERKGFSDIG